MHIIWEIIGEEDKRIKRKIHKEADYDKEKILEDRSRLGSWGRGRSKRDKKNFIEEKEQVVKLL